MRELCCGGGEGDHELVCESGHHCLAAHLLNTQGPGLERQLGGRNMISIRVRTWGQSTDSRCRGTGAASLGPPSQAESSPRGLFRGASLAAPGLPLPCLLLAAASLAPAIPGAWTGHPGTQKGKKESFASFLLVNSPLGRWEYPTQPFPGPALPELGLVWEKELASRILLVTCSAPTASITPQFSILSPHCLQVSQPEYYQMGF